MMARHLPRGSARPVRPDGAPALWARVALGAYSATLLLALLAGGPRPASAQSCSDSDPDVVLEIQDLGLGAVEMFFVSDFDPSGPGHHRLLFGFSIGNTSTTTPRTLTLQLIVTADGDELVDGETEPFTLAPGEFRRATNLELSDRASDFELDEISVSPEGEALEDVILETGFLPEGHYVFEIILNESGNEIERCALDLRPTNPRNIELITPGDQFGGQLPRVSSPFPQFQWLSQGRQFRFRLCPVLPGDSSGEEAMENQPIFRTLHGSTTLLYPSSAERLQNGRRYCWQVKVVINSSGGDFLQPSDIFCFRVSTGVGVQTVDAMLNSLLGGLGGDVLEALLGELEGFEPTGQITVNGQVVNAGDLQALIAQLRAQGWSVGSVEVQ